MSWMACSTNDTVLRPKTHYTDTQDFTEQLFGLCYLLGLQCLRRMKDLKDQQLYKMSRTTSYGPLDPIFRATVDLPLIAEQWDQLLRIAASLQHRTAPADVILKWLVGGAPSERLAVVFQRWMCVAARCCQPSASLCSRPDLPHDPYAFGGTRSRHCIACCCMSW
jgi:Tn3 transposase DDE domain